jgi:hypothetical protein
MPSSLFIFSVISRNPGLLMLHYGVTKGPADDPGPLQFRQIDRLGLTDISPEAGFPFYTFILVDPSSFFPRLEL